MGKKAQIRRSKIEEEERRRKEELEAIRRQKYPWSRFWQRPLFWIYSVCLLLLIAFPFVNPYLNNSTEGSKTMTKTAVISTSLGDIELELFSDAAPKTVENFTLLARRGYYDGLSWHRVIQDFIIQSGDPLGDGTGGESAWGGTFQDEINPIALGLDDEMIKNYQEEGYLYDFNLPSRHMEAGVIAMANSGPNTNGSQFFIVTQSAQAHLDGRHTVFGKVTSGMETVRNIAGVPVDEEDKPTEPVIINKIEIK